MRFSPRPTMIRLAAATALVAMMGASPAWADPYWANQAIDVNKAITAAEETFTKGDLTGAKRGLTEAYFHHFEDSKLEAAVRRFISAKRATQVEKMFSDMRKAMTAGKADEVKSIADELRAAVTADAKTLDAENVAPGVFEVNQ